MKILFFIYSLSTGGAERVLTNLANYWSSKGHKIVVVTIAPLESDFYNLEEKIERLSLGLSDFSSGKIDAVFKNFYRCLALRKILQEFSPKVAISFMSTSNILLAFSSLGLREIITVGSERTYPPKFFLGFVWEKLRRYFYRNLDYIVTQTSIVESWCINHTLAKRVVKIPNPVTDRYTLPKLEESRDLKISKRERILLAVGRLIKEKQFNLLIDSFNLLTDEFPSWSLYIIGEGVERASLERQIEEAKLSKKVILLGRIIDVARWYRRADIFVMTSEFEGFPNVLVEAMSHGCPVISFDCNAGPRDIIHHEIDGLLVCPEKINGLTEAMRKLMNDDNLRYQLANRAIEVKNKFSLVKIAYLWEKLFDEKNL